MQYDYDLLIVGGGLAGNSLALALKDSAMRIALLEASSREQIQHSPAGDRALALSAGTILLLQALDAWDGIKKQATAIKTIHVSDQGHFAKFRLSAKKEGVEALGYIINARNIEEHLATLLAKTTIKQICPGRVTGLISTSDAIHISLKKGDIPISLSAKLVVGADGGQSTVRRLLEIPQQLTGYEQTALITTIKSSLPHNNVAYERFTASGPLAVLPLSNGECSIVWTRDPEDAKNLMLGSEADFIAQLQSCFGYALGALTLTAPRRIFPLTLVRAESMVSGRTVIIGNAVHQLHPVAGQGFNLGIRDVAQLAESLVEQQQKGADIGNLAFLQGYAEQREKDHKQTIHFTDGLIKLFSTDCLPVVAARGIGLGIMDRIPIAKSMLAKQAMGLAGRLPRIGHRQ